MARGGGEIRGCEPHNGPSVAFDIGILDNARISSSGRSLADGEEIRQQPISPYQHGLFEAL
jgi:hypothetical protein